jgi:uncharacterized protein YndB with AHSA1/START domain
VFGHDTEEYVAHSTSRQFSSLARPHSPRVRTQQITLRLDAPPERVYRALLDPALIPAWRVPDGMTCVVHTFEAREGGAFRVSLTYDTPDGQGKSDGQTDTYSGYFAELVPQRRVVEVLAFESADPLLRAPMRIITTLTDDDGGTIFTAVHEGLPESVSDADNEEGWRQSLAKLAQVLRTSTT